MLVLVHCHICFHIIEFYWHFIVPIIEYKKIWREEDEGRRVDYMTFRVLFYTTHRARPKIMSPQSPVLWMSLCPVVLSFPFALFLVGRTLYQKGVKRFMKRKRDKFYCAQHPRGMSQWELGVDNKLPPRRLMVPTPNASSTQWVYSKRLLNSLNC